MTKVRVERTIVFHWDVEIDGPLTSGVWGSFAHTTIDVALSELDRDDTVVDSVMSRVFEEHVIPPIGPRPGSDIKFNIPGGGNL